MDARRRFKSFPTHPATATKRSRGKLVAPVLRDFCGLESLLEGRHVVRFQKVEKRRALRLEAKLGAFLRKPFFPLGVFIRAVGLDAGAPLLDFINRFRRAVAVEPIDQLLIRGTGGKERPYVVDLHTLKAEQHLVERASEVIFTGHAVHGGSAFIRHARSQCVIAQPRAGAAWRFLSQIFESAHF